MEAGRPGLGVKLWKCKHEVNQGKNKFTQEAVCWMTSCKDTGGRKSAPVPNVPWCHTGQGDCSTGKSGNAVPGQKQ